MPSLFLKGVEYYMLQVYSNGVTITVPEEGVVFVPFNNVSKDKGCDSRLVAPGTIQIDRQGVYDGHVNGTVMAETEGDYVIQLYVNGVAQSETMTRLTLTADEYVSFSFEDLVTVAKGNSCCCYSSPTLLQVGIYSLADVTGDVTFGNISELVTRLC